MAAWLSSTAAPAAGSASSWRANSGNGLPTARSMTRPAAKNPPEQYQASVPGSAVTGRSTKAFTQSFVS